MKPLSDKEIQDLLDQKLSHSNITDESSLHDLEAYQAVYDALKDDEDLHGAPMNFSSKVSQVVFLETQRKKDRNQIFLIATILGSILSVSALIFTYYNITLTNPIENIFQDSWLLLIAFSVLIFTAIQYADYQWVRK